MKIVINANFGGFTLPPKYMETHPEIKNVYHCWHSETPICEHRIDPRLMEIVESEDYRGDLHVAEIPDGSHYELNEYDGLETIYYSQSSISTYPNDSNA